MNYKAEISIEPEIRLDLAIDALDAVRDLCIEASNGQDYPNLNHVDPDHFASLIGLIVNEMRDAQRFLTQPAPSHPGINAHSREAVQ